jgi:hypothetical protein
MKNGGVLSMIVDSLSNGKLIIEIPRVLVNSSLISWDWDTHMFKM